MICEDEVRKLSIDEIMNGSEEQEIWIQVRERVTAWPVRYSHLAQMDDGRSYLVFNMVGSKDTNMLAPTLMGKTWVAWNAKPSAMKRREAFYHG